MAWHTFEKLLTEVGKYSTFIGKVWITFLFTFRLIIVASIGDTVYSDEQSAFKCNTLQPGCENVCFNDFSPISQIRFWAVQILFVGTPSIMFIVYAMHAVSRVTPTSDVKQSDVESENDEAEERPPRRSWKKTESSLTSSNGTHLPHYDEIIYTGKNGVNRRFSKNSKSSHMTSRLSGHRMARKRCKLRKNVDESFNKTTTIKREGFHRERKTKGKGKMKRKKFYQQHGVSDVVTTFWIEIAYTGQAVLRTIIEAVFLYLQYRLYNFNVPELYRCKRSPCPLTVECFVSRPKEKTIFLRFMYAMTVLSLVLNAIELIILAVKWTRRCGKNAGGEDTIFDRKLPVEVIQCRRNTRHVILKSFPQLAPFPRDHDSSLGDFSDDDIIDSDNVVYDVV
ncbi:gap junction Cx32.2 protein-like isoform X2 [Clavelina lepadiformis]|uniref:gap junction Cx32.2 protein-like isoform X2 n=1 Tax=Clavelina lepadiformis TaxID=159417 RepID=UPI0040432EF0